MDRRTYLTLLPAAALAGCSGAENGDGSDPDTPDPDAAVPGGRTTERESPPLTTTTAPATTPAEPPTETTAEPATPTPEPTTTTTTTTSTPTPTQAADVDIERDELVVQEREYTTNVYVAATVTNTGPVASGSVELTVNWFDQEGSYIEDTTAYCNTIGAGETWAARIYANTLEPDRYADYELTGEVDERSPVAPDGLAVTDSRLLAGDDEAKITGTITNTGNDTVEYAEVIAKVYNSDGQIITTEWTNEADITAGAEWGVELTAYLPRRADAVDAHALMLAGGR